MDIYSLISSAAKEKLKYYPKIAARIPADIARLQAEARAEAEVAYNAQEAEHKKQQQTAKQVEKETKAKQEKLKKEEQKESDRLNKIITNSEKELRKKAKVEETHINKDYEKHETSLRVKEKEKKTEQLESDLLYQTEQKTLKDLEEKANLERKFILEDSEKASNKLVPELTHTFKTGDYVVGESVSGTFIKDLGVAKGANWAEVRDEKGRIHSIKVDELKPDLTDAELLGKEIPKSSKEGHIPTKGQSMVWSGPDYDFPVTFEDIIKGEDGVNYAKVKNHLGSDSIVPLDQLKESNEKLDPKNLSQTTDPTNIRNIKGDDPNKISQETWDMLENFEADPEKVHGGSKPPKKVVKATQPTRTENRYVSPESAKTQYDNPLAGLSKKTFADQLKGMGIYVVDVETTGVEFKDKMFSAARVKIDPKTGQSIGPEHEVESHFDVGTSDKIDRKYFKTEAEYQEALEKNLARAHSSKQFGQAQKERGSLAGNAKARMAGELTTPANFLEGIENEIAGNQRGSIIFTHNSNFENSQFKKVYEEGEEEFVNVFDKLLARNIVNDSGLFGSSDLMSNHRKSKDFRGLTQKTSDILYGELHESILENNPENLRHALGKYTAANVDVLNELQNQIEAVRLKGGEYTVGDSMHISRAYMALGAQTGQIDPRNLIVGNKIETLAKAFYDEDEYHEALKDAKLQGRVTATMMEEIDKFRADPNYKSENLSKLNSILTEGTVVDDTFKDSIMRQVRSLESISDMRAIDEINEWADETTHRYSIGHGDKDGRSNFRDQFKIEFDKAVRAEGATADSVKTAMEKFSETFKIDGSASSNTPTPLVDRAKSIMSELGNKKKVLAIAGGLGAANLFIGGGEKGQDKKYNTYDELYNNQYYGSGFADWQERNNAHKVLY